MRTLARWMVLIVILAGCLTGCDRRAEAIAGSYAAGATIEPATLSAIFIDRENETAWLHFLDGSVVIAPYTTRPQSAWPSGCPANLGSTRMEVLELPLDALELGTATLRDPILVRNCPPDPVELALREAGEIGGAGTACAGAETCPLLAWKSDEAPLPESMKGYELYSWREDPGEPWTYTLITGTNRNKTWDEISASESVVSAEGWVKLTVSGEARLRSVLSRLPEGATVVWIGPDAAPASPDLHARIAIPDAKTVRALVAYARDRGLHLVAPNPTTAAVTGDQARAQTIPTVARASDIVGDATAATQTETLKVVPTACLALTEASRIVMIEDPQPATTPAPACPGIETFTAETVAAPAGTGVTLTWQTRGDPRVTICPVIEDRVVGCRCLWNLPPSGTSVLSPNDIIARYSGFVLQLDGPEGCPAGDCVTETTDLAVACPPSAPPWFFEPEPAMCPDTPAVATAAAQQPFEGGTMIWTEAQDRYTILYDTFVPPSGTEPISASLKSLQILQGPLDLLPGASPDNRLGEPPPEGMAQPESGFGLVWRGEVAGSEHVRAHLGWARAPEQGFTAHIQCEVACGAHQACYLRDTQGNVLRISYLMHVGHIWDVVSPGHAAP